MFKCKWLYRFAAEIDYGLLLPLISRISPRYAGGAVWLRGAVNYFFDLEWRNIALRRSYVRHQTYKTMSEIAGGDNVKVFSRLTFMRFIGVSWEEYDAERIAHGRLNHIQWHASGLSELIRINKSGRGVVLMTGHFDSLYIGLTILAQQGLIVNLMSTRTVEHPDVPSAIRKFFLRKIGGMSKLFAPGKVAHFEDGLKFFINALRRGEIVVIACDGPAHIGQNASIVQFLGNEWAMAPGPEFLAKQSNSLVSMYICRRNNIGNYAIEISAPLPVNEGGVQHAFDFLDHHIRLTPDRWWAADLYQQYWRHPD